MVPGQMVDILLIIHEIIIPSLTGQNTMVQKKKTGTDATDRKDLTIGEPIPVKIFTKDIHSVYLTCNSRFAEDLHIGPEEIIGKTDYDFFPQDLADGYRENDKKVMLSGQTQEINEEFQRNGKKCWIHSIITPYCDTDGNCIGILGILRDITRERDDEIALRESEERYRFIVENSHDAVFIYRKDRFRYVNPSAGEISGWTVDELLHMDIWTLVHADDHEVLHEYSRIKGWDKNPVTYTLRILTKQGDTRYVDITLDRIVLSGQPAILGVVKDITRRREAEEALRESEKKYRLLYDNMRDACVSVDMTGRITGFNNAFVQLIGYEPHEIYALLNLDIIPKRWHAMVTVSIRDQVFTRGFSDLYEIEYERYDGQIVPVELRTHLILDENGNPQGIWTIARDITKRKQTNKQLITSETRFLELFKIISSGVVVYDVHGAGTDFIFKDINPAGEMILQVKKDNIIGFSLFTLFPGLNAVGFHTALQRVWKTGVPEPFQMVYHSKKMRKTWTDNYIYSLSSDEIVVVFDDITVQKQNEEAIIESNTYHRGLLEASLDPLVTIDLDGTIHDVNLATVQITGQSRDHLIGTDFSDYFTEPEKAKAGYKKVFKDGVITDYELHIRHKDGHVTPVLYNATLIRDATRDTAIVFAAARNITERKRNEELLIRFNEELERGIQEKTNELATVNSALQEENMQRIQAESTIRKTLSLLHAAIESTADGILVADQEGTVTTYNRKFMDLWNIEIDSPDQYNHSQLVNHIAAQLKDPTAYLKSVHELYDNPERERFDMLELKDGRIFERYSIPQKVGNTIVGRVWSYRDVTQRRRVQEQIVASLDEKEVLLREIHHRVKNNLQLISSLLDMTRMRTGDPGTSSILTDVMMKIRTMSQIHTRLYESTQFDKIDMKTQIEDQLRAISTIYSHSDCDIICTIKASELYLPVDQAIPCALILNEILSNAYKHAFTGRNNGTITITMFQENESVRITVLDDGIGIAPGFDIAMANSLGLKLVRNLVQQQLKGTLTIERKEGTEITVSFPMNIP